MDTIPSNIMGRASIVNFGGQMAGVVSAPILAGIKAAAEVTTAFIFMIAALLCSAVVTLTVKRFACRRCNTQ